MARKSLGCNDRLPEPLGRRQAIHGEGGDDVPGPYGYRRVAYLYGDVEGLPVAFFGDREQRVAAIHAGAASRKSVEKTIQTLLNATQ